MNPLKFPLALFAFLAFGILVPVWMYFFDAYGGGLSMEARFLAGLFLPVAALLFLGSWLQPRGT